MEVPVTHMRRTPWDLLPGRITVVAFGKSRHALTSYPLLKNRELIASLNDAEHILAVKERLDGTEEPPPRHDHQHRRIRASGRHSRRFRCHHQMGSYHSRSRDHAMGRRSITGTSRTSGTSVLGLEQVSQLVDVVSEELGTRGGITTPFIFSSMALDMSSTSTKRLMRTFIDACADPGPKLHRFREEARFAGPHELGMLLRWGLGRLVRIVDGQEERGLISWDHYTDFRDSELAANFPPTHFSTFLPPLPAHLRSVVITVLSVLTRLTANSSTSGHTPLDAFSVVRAPLLRSGPAGTALPPYLRLLSTRHERHGAHHSLLHSLPGYSKGELRIHGCPYAPQRMDKGISNYACRPVIETPTTQRCSYFPRPQCFAVTCECTPRTSSSLLRRGSVIWEKSSASHPSSTLMGYRKRMDMPSQFEAGQEDGERLPKSHRSQVGRIRVAGIWRMGQDKAAV